MIKYATQPLWETEKDSAVDVLEQESKDSSIVMMGLKAPDEDFDAYYRQLKENTKKNQ